MERCKEYVARAKAINPDSEAVSSGGEDVSCCAVPVGVSADRPCLSGECGVMIVVGVSLA
jgi:sugar (pentulose or hexulose) kinase